MEHDVAQPDAVRDRRARQGERPSRREFIGGRGQRLQLARGDHLGQQHRRRLQHLDLFVDVLPACLVLHDQHAERVAAAQDRDAEEGGIDLLAGLRPVRERGMLLRVGQCEALRAARDEADETLVRADGGEVDRLAVQTFGRVEFETRVGAQHVDRADLGDHVGGDLDHDAIEARLRVDRFRHDFAEPTQQQTGAALSALHGPILSPSSLRASPVADRTAVQACRSVSAVSVRPYTGCELGAASPPLVVRSYLADAGQGYETPLSYAGSPFTR